MEKYTWTAIDELKKKISLLNQEISNPLNALEKKETLKSEVEKFMLLLSEAVTFMEMPTGQLREKLQYFQGSESEKQELKFLLIKKLEKEIEQLRWAVLQPFGNKDNAYKSIAELNSEIRLLKDVNF